MNFSMQVGSTATFSAVLTPVNGAQASGTFPKWTASDPLAVLTPSPDGSTCDVALPASDTAQSFDLGISAVSADANVGTVTTTHTITVTPAAAPPLTGIDFVQTAG